MASIHDMTPPASPRRSLPPQSPKRKELRKRLMILTASVVVLHSAAIGIFYGMRIGERAVKTQQTFIAVWLVATLGVVTTQMKGIRRLRREKPSGG